MKSIRVERIERKMMLDFKKRTKLYIKEKIRAKLLTNYVKCDIKKS